MKSRKIAVTTLVLLAAALIVPTWAQTPDAGEATPKTLGTSLNAVAGLLPPDTCILVKIDPHALIKSGYGGYGEDIDLREDILRKIPGFDKFYDFISKAELTPFSITKSEDEKTPDTWTPADYVKMIYVTRASFSDDANDISVLLVGDANLNSAATQKSLTENENLKVKADENGKTWAVTGLLAEDETLYLTQLDGAIAVTRTRDAAVAFLDRQTAGDKADSLKKNEAMYNFADKYTINPNVINVIAVVSDAQREKLALAEDETAFLKDIKTLRIGVNSTRGSYEIDAHCECVSEKAAENVSTKLKALKLGAMLAASESSLRRFYNSAEIDINNRTTVRVAIVFNVDQLKLLAFGSEKEEKPAEEDKDKPDGGTGGGDAPPGPGE